MAILRENQRLDAIAEYNDIALYNIALLNAARWDGRGVFQQNDELDLEIGALDFRFEEPVPAVSALLNQLISDDNVDYDELGRIAVGWDTGVEVASREAVFQAITARLQVYKGTRWGRPDFGSRIVDRLGNPLNQGTANRLDRQIMSELEKDKDWYVVDSITWSGDYRNERLSGTVTVTILSTGEQVTVSI